MELLEGRLRLGQLVKQYRQAWGFTSHHAFAEYLTKLLKNKYPEISGVRIAPAAVRAFEAATARQQQNPAVVIAIVESGVIPGLDYNSLYRILLGEEVRLPADPKKFMQSNASKLRLALADAIGVPLGDADLVHSLVQSGIAQADAQAILDGEAISTRNAIVLARLLRISLQQFDRIYVQASRRSPAEAVSA